MNLPIRHLVAASLLAFPFVCQATDQTSAPAQAAAPAASPSATTPAAAAAAPTQAAASAAPAAAAPGQPVAGGKLAAPPEGKGQVVFFRERRFTGAAVSFMVREGTKELGKLGTGNYFVATLDPGPHDFAVHSENKDTLHMEVEAGETYYVVGSITMGFLVGETHIAPSDETTFLADYEKLKLSN